MLGFPLLATMDRALQLRSPLRQEATSLKRKWNNVRASSLEIFYWERQGSILGEACLSEKEHQMNNERKPSKAGERAAEGLREATANEEAKNESKTGHDLVKGADRFEERSKSSDGKSAQEKQKE
jgi:hypothetical protein